MQFYSQSGQDKYLYETFFKDKTDGFFIDIGAHDGISGSNTLFFENLGWHGYCFEPIPHVFEQLRKNRTCGCMQAAISNYTGKGSFKVITGHSEMLSGLIDNYSLDHQDRIKREFHEHVQQEEIIEVDTYTFDEVMYEAWLDIPEIYLPHIDILSIDVEGAEGSILRDIYLDKYNIDTMIIEFNQYDKDLVDYICSKGYYVATSLGVDIIFKKL